MPENRYRKNLSVALALIMVIANDGWAVNPFMNNQTAQPAPILGFGAQSDQGLGISFMTWQSTRDKTRSGTTDVPNTFDDKLVSWRYTLLLDYSFYKNWTALVSIPYVTNHSTDNLPLDDFTSGVGDVGFYAKYAFYKDQVFHARREFSGLFGIEAPTGSTSQTNANNTIPSTVQAGSGSTNWILGTTGVWGFDPFSLYGSITYKIYGPASYSFGNIFCSQLGVNYPLPGIKSLSLTAEWLALVVAHDKTDDTTSAGTVTILPDGTVLDSGGVTQYLAPGFQWRPWSDWALGFNVEVPVYQNLYGTQLKDGLNYVLSVSTRFGGPHVAPE